MARCMGVQLPPGRGRASRGERGTKSRQRDDDAVEATGLVVHGARIQDDFRGEEALDELGHERRKIRPSKSSELDMDI